MLSRKKITDSLLWASRDRRRCFVRLIFWGWLWGLPGLFFAVPIMMVIKSISDHVEALQPVATLLKHYLAE